MLPWHYINLFPEYKFTKKLNTTVATVGDTFSGYTTLTAAKDACAMNNNCYLIYNYKCDGGDYETYTKGTSLSKSTIGSCVWIKEGKYWIRQHIITIFWYYSDTRESNISL